MKSTLHPIGPAGRTEDETLSHLLDLRWCVEGNSVATAVVTARERSARAAKQCIVHAEMTVMAVVVVRSVVVTSVVVTNVVVTSVAGANVEVEIDVEMIGVMVATGAETNDEMKVIGLPPVADAGTIAETIGAGSRTTCVVMILEHVVVRVAKDADE